MKKRSLWKMFLLEIVTLGIYRIYYFIKTRREMMEHDPSIKIKSPWFVIVSILVIIAAVIFLIASVAVQAAHNGDSCYASTSYGTPNYSVVGSQPVSYNLDQQVSPTLSSSSNTDCKMSPLTIVSLVILYPAILVAVILFVVWEWSYSHGVEKVTGEKLSFALSLVILILVPDGIDILIIQDYFNKVGDPHPAAHKPAAPIA